MQPPKHLYLGTVGFAVLGVASIVFLMTEVTHRHVRQTIRSTYDVSASFDHIGDLKVGARVLMAGVDIGRVADIRLDTERHKAVVLMRLSRTFNQIPQDSAASINTQGVLGGKFIGISNGASSRYLQDRDRIESTRSAVSLEELVRKLLAHLT